MAGYIGNIPVPQATQTRDTFTATAGQTSFATSGYTPNFLDVYLNGVKLPAEDFTATNGTDVVLDTGAAVDDILEVVAFTTFETAGDEFTLTDITARDSNGIQFNTDEGTERVRIDDSGNVGIGTSSPTEALSVVGGNILIDNNADSTLFLGKGAEGVDGVVKIKAVQTGADSDQLGMAFYTHPSTIGSALSEEAMRIDSSGNLLVGKTSADGTSVGVEIRPDSVRASRASNPVGFFNRKTTDGEIVRFQKDGTTVGSIGSRNGVAATLTLDPRASGCGLSGAGQFVWPMDESGAASNGNITLGASSARFKDLYLSGGVYLGGTGSANKLDDYETGTWTVNIIGSTTAGSYSAISKYAWYAKVGRLVTVGFYFYGSSGTGAGDIRISGLPFTPAGNSEAIGSLQYNAGLDLPSGTNTPSLFVQASSTTMQVRCNSDSAGVYSHMPYPTLANYVRGSVSYYTNS